MVVPWNGFPLSKLIKILDPKSDTKYVEFETFFRPDEANNQKQSWYPWPYKEIITINEAMHPLSFIATGVYGKPLPKQNGAPIRLVLPWKYGFKSIKSIVKINFTKLKPNHFGKLLLQKNMDFGQMLILAFLTEDGAKHTKRILIQAKNILPYYLMDIAMGFFIICKCKK